VEASFGLSDGPTLYCKEIRVPPEIKELLSGISSETLDLENFAVAHRSTVSMMNWTVFLLMK